MEKTLKEQIEEDERNCVPGSLAHDRKLSQEREEELKERAIKDGACIGKNNKK